MEPIATNRLTYLTARWIFGNGHEAEFYACQTPEDVKALVWKYMKPHFNIEERKLAGFKNTRVEDATTVDNIDSKRPMNKLLADPIYFVIPTKESLANFVKGIRFVSFPALFEYAKEHKKSISSAPVEQREQGRPTDRPTDGN